MPLRGEHQIRLPLLYMERAGVRLYFRPVKLYNKSEHIAIRRRLRRDSTYTEKLIWQRVRNSQIAGVRFKRQYGIDNFVLDFYAPEVRLAIELDGASHDEEGASARDAFRQRIIEGYNITFLRFTDTQVTTNIDKVLEEIKRVVQEKLSPN